MMKFNYDYYMSCDDREMIDLRGESILIRLIYEQQFDNAIKVLKAGASTRAKNSFNQRPLHIAARNGAHTLVKELLNHGADIHVVDRNFQTPLHEAVWSGNIECVHHLTTSHNINKVNKMGLSPLMYSIGSKSFEIFKYLVDMGANISYRAQDGNTALHFLCLRDEKRLDDVIKIIHFLVDKKFDFKTKNNKGLTVHDIISQDIKEGLTCTNRMFDVLSEIEYAIAKEQKSVIYDSIQSDSTDYKAKKRM